MAVCFDMHGASCLSAVETLALYSPPYLLYVHANKKGVQTTMRPWCELASRSDHLPVFSLWCLEPDPVAGTKRSRTVSLPLET